MLRKRRARGVEFRRHLFNVKKELLLGVRSILDSRIKDIERKTGELEKMKKRYEKVPVQ